MLTAQEWTELAQAVRERDIYGWGIGLLRCLAEDSAVTMPDEVRALLDTREEGSHEVPDNVPRETQGV